MRHAAPGVLLVVLAAACSGGGHHHDEADADAYRDALAASAQEAWSDGDTSFSAEATACYGSAFLDVVGLDRLAEQVTPEEIEDDPEGDWNVDITEEEGVAIFREMVDCESGVVDEFAGLFSRSINADSDSPVEVDEACMAEIDPSEIEGLMGSGISHPEDDRLSREHAAVITDWMMGCGDVRQMMLDELAAQADDPEGMAACLDGKVDDTLIREMLIAGYTGDGAEPEETSEGAELQAIVLACITA